MVPTDQSRSRLDAGGEKVCPNRERGTSNRVRSDTVSQVYIWATL